MQNAEEMDYRKIGDNIKKLRRQKGISQIELAKAIEVSQTHMSNIENGNTGISLWTAVKISRMLDCSVDMLVDNIKRESKSTEKEKYLIYVDELADILKIMALKSRKSRENS